MSLDLTDGKLLWCLLVCSFLQADARNAVQLSRCSPHTVLEQLLILTVSQDKWTMRVYRSAAGFPLVSVCSSVWTRFETGNS